MELTRETKLEEFEFWSGGRDNAMLLNLEEMRFVEEILEDCYPEGMRETALNDLFWFDFEESICNWLDTTWEELDERNENNAWSLSISEYRHYKPIIDMIKVYTNNFVFRQERCTAEGMEGDEYYWFMHVPYKEADISHVEALKTELDQLNRPNWDHCYELVILA